MHRSLQIPHIMIPWYSLSLIFFTSYDNLQVPRPHHKRNCGTTWQIQSLIKLLLKDNLIFFTANMTKISELFPYQRMQFCESEESKKCIFKLLLCHGISDRKEVVWISKAWWIFFSPGMCQGTHCPLYGRGFRKPVQGVMSTLQLITRFPSVEISCKIFKGILDPQKVKKTCRG